MIKISQKKLITLLVVLAILGVAVLVLFAEKIGLIDNGDNGYLHVGHYENGWTVLVDNQAEELSARNPNIKVPAGLRDVIIFADGYWPWFKQIRVETDQVAEISPFLAPKARATTTIPSSDPEYDRLVRDSSVRIPASTGNPVASSDESTLVLVERGDVYAKWQADEDLPAYFCIEACTPTIMILDGETPIKNIAFWKNRNDVVVMSAGTGIYVFEIDGRGIRNFAPIYEGTDPTFHTASDGTIYIYDQNTLLKFADE